MIRANTKNQDESLVIFTRRMPSGYVDSIPQDLTLIKSHTSRKYNIIGDSNGFRFFHTPFSIVSASFNINDFTVDNEEFLLKLKIMFSTLEGLNNEPTRSSDVFKILEHIHRNGRYVFNLMEMYLSMIAFPSDLSLVIIQKRDYSMLEYRAAEKKIDFLKALNLARKTVNADYNLREFFYFLEARITKGDYSYITPMTVIGHKNNNLLIYAVIRKFNLLCTGRQRQSRKLLKSEPLFNSSTKRFTLKALSLNPQQEYAYIKKATTMHERELKKINQLIDNRKIVHQLYIILSELTGLDNSLIIKSDTVRQDLLKSELMNIISRTISYDPIPGSVQFDKVYKKKLSNNLHNLAVKKGTLNFGISTLA